MMHTIPEEGNITEVEMRKCFSNLEASEYAYEKMTRRMKRLQNIADDPREKKRELRYCLRKLTKLVKKFRKKELIQICYEYLPPREKEIICKIAYIILKINFFSRV